MGKNLILLEVFGCFILFTRYLLETPNVQAERTEIQCDVSSE